LVVVVVWLLYVIFLVPRNPNVGLGPPPLEPPTTTVAADFAWKLVDLDGKPVDFTTFQGRTVFLNIWASWCPPCRAEMPSILSLASQPRLKDVAFVLVASGDEPGAVRQFVDKNPGMRAVSLTMAIAQEPHRDFYTEAIPATFVIAPDGRIVLKHIGAAQWDALEVVDFLVGLTGKETAAIDPTESPAP
jgi:thiol-disulfide isomerase/thioredoxin